MFEFGQNPIYLYRDVFSRPPWRPADLDIWLSSDTRDRRPCKACKGSGVESSAPPEPPHA